MVHPNRDQKCHGRRSFGVLCFVCGQMCFSDFFLFITVTQKTNLDNSNGYAYVTLSHFHFCHFFLIFSSGADFKFVKLTFFAKSSIDSFLFQRRLIRPTRHAVFQSIILMGSILSRVDPRHANDDDDISLAGVGEVVSTVAAAGSSRGAGVSSSSSSSSFDSRKKSGDSKRRSSVESSENKR